MLLIISEEALESKMEACLCGCPCNCGCVVILLVVLVHFIKEAPGPVIFNRVQDLVAKACPREGLGPRWSEAGVCVEIKCANSDVHLFDFE